ncbi:MAG: hypothetical protein PHP08_03045 [Candidatus Dojkabacteria bacterium]|nr:hypothetical protein [Candidatus Dojkabacteria bacterium]
MALQDLDLSSHLGIGEEIPVRDLENVVLEYGELRHWLYVVIDVIIADQAMRGEVIPGSLYLILGVVISLRIVDVGLYQYDEQSLLGTAGFDLELGEVDHVFEASAGSVFDHKALLISGTHLIKEKRDQLDFHIVQLTFLDDLTVFTK